MTVNRRITGFMDNSSPSTEFEPGEMIRPIDTEDDEDDDNTMVVVSIPGKQANEYEIDPLSGMTVYDYSETANAVEPDEPVVEAVYVSTLLHYADRLPDGCTPTSAHEHVQEIRESPATVYAYPVSQVESAQ